MGSPTISVIIPLYNHEKFVKEAVNSVLKQSFQDFELIIINDGSTDNSENIIKNIKDERIKYFYQENQGAHNAINRGIRLSRGKYISILNSDDAYYPERFEETLKIFESDRSIRAVFSYIELINEEGNPIGLKKGADDNWLGFDHNTSFREHNNIIFDLLAGNFLHTTSNLFCKKNVFDTIGYFSDLKYTHDYDFFLRLCYHYNIHIIKKPLLKYRFHSANTLSKDFAASVFETGLVLANFLINYDLPEINSKKERLSEFMAKFFNSINTYDTDRMIMTMLLFGLRYNIKHDFFNIFKDQENIFRKVCLDRFKRHRDISLLKERLSWQEGQAELWWKKAEELRNTLEWQKKQTDLWWKRSEEFKTELASQKKQTELWQTKAEQLLEKAKILDSIQSSVSWKLFSGLGNILDKFSYAVSKKRSWLRNLLRKIIL